MISHTLRPGRLAPRRASEVAIYDTASRPIVSQTRKTPYVGDAILRRSARRDRPGSRARARRAVLAARRVMAVHSPSCLEAMSCGHPGASCVCDGNRFVEIAPGIYHVREPRHPAPILIIIEDPETVDRFWCTVTVYSRHRSLMVDGTFADARRATIAMFDEIESEARS